MKYDSRAWTGEPATYCADIRRWIFGDYRMLFYVAQYQASKPVGEG